MIGRRARCRGTFLTTGALGLAALGAYVTTGLAAGNIVPGSKASLTVVTIGPNDVKPNECDGITLTTIVIAAGDVDGTAANELILGTPGSEWLRGAGGSDCAVGGGGPDAPEGDDGDDVLLGGPGPDDLAGGAGTDACYGNAGPDTFNSCETSVQ